MEEYSLFKKGIEPEWGDPKNAIGGEWFCRQYFEADQLDLYWQNLVMALVGETIEDVGKAVAWLGGEKVAIHDHCYAFRHSMDPTFVSYCMQTTSFIAEKAKYIASAKVNTLLIKGFSNVSIPVPYPNDPEKSLAEQARIVSILNKFSTLTSSIKEGLPREIGLRQKQYEYYRDLLLSYPKPEVTL